MLCVTCVTMHCTPSKPGEWVNGVLDNLCAHIGWTGPWALPEDSEMNEMTLPSRHSTQNLSPGGLRPSTLPLGHRSSPQYWIFTSEREKNFCFFETWTPDRLSEQGPRKVNSINPTLVQCWATVYDAVSALSQHSLCVSCRSFTSLSPGGDRVDKVKVE